MLRSITISLALLSAACAGEESSTVGGTQADASVVVATTPEVPDDRPVVVFLGTSLTAGLGLERDEDTYVAHLSELADSAGTPTRAAP